MGLTDGCRLCLVLRMLMMSEPAFMIVGMVKHEFRCVALFLAVILAAAVGGCSLVGQVPGVEESPISSAASDVVAQLVSVTDASGAGPTQDYYWIAGAAQVDVTHFPATGQVAFTEDGLGRSGVARGALTYEMFAESRGARQGDPLDPPGWPDKNPLVEITYGVEKKGQPIVYHGYMWTRSHSIADSLAGEASYTSPDNFTAGTRPQNVGADQHGGMRAPEEAAEAYWADHPDTDAVVWYQTTPVYVGAEVIPRGSIVDERSSDGVVDAEYVVINDAEGWLIDYTTGVATRR